MIEHFSVWERQSKNRLSRRVRLDQWAAHQPDKPSRAEAIRWLVKMGLKRK